MIDQRLGHLHFALSPDGRFLVFVASKTPTATAQHLFLQALDKTDAQPIPGTDGARNPFWSPDSKSIGFFASEKLFRIDISGGPAQCATMARTDARSFSSPLTAR